MGFTFNPLLKIGLDKSGASQAAGINFSYHTVESSESITIPASQQMILVGGLLVDGELIVDGQIIIDDFSEPLGFDSNFSFKQIPVGRVVNIGSTKEMLLESPLLLDGVLEVDGSMSFVKDDIEPKFPLFNIPANTCVYVEENQEYFLSNGLILDGILDMKGMLSLGA
jgi:hypothetical protein